MRGIGEPQRQIGEDGFGVSGAPEALPMPIGPIEIGNRHSQHTSAIGFTKRPVQVWADVELGASADSSSAIPSKTAARRVTAGSPGQGGAPR